MLQGFACDGGLSTNAWLYMFLFWDKMFALIKPNAPKNQKIYTASKIDVEQTQVRSDLPLCTFCNDACSQQCD